MKYRKFEVKVFNDEHELVGEYELESVLTSETVCWQIDAALQYVGVVLGHYEHDPNIKQESFKFTRH